MSIFKPKQHSEAELAKNFLQYINDFESVKNQFFTANQKLARLKLVCIVLCLISAFWFPASLIGLRSTWFLMLGLVFIFLTIEKIELMTKHETITEAVKYFDKEKLTNLVK